MPTSQDWAVEHPRAAEQMTQALIRQLNPEDRFQFFALNAEDHRDLLSRLEDTVLTVLTHGEEIPHPRRALIIGMVGPRYEELDARTQSTKLAVLTTLTRACLDHDLSLYGIVDRRPVDVEFFLRLAASCNGDLERQRDYWFIGSSRRELEHAYARILSDMRGASAAGGGSAGKMPTLYIVLAAGIVLATGIGMVWLTRTLWTPERRQYLLDAWAAHRGSPDGHAEEDEGSDREAVDQENEEGASDIETVSLGKISTASASEA